MKKIYIIVITLIISCVVFTLDPIASKSTNESNSTSHKANWSDLDCPQKLYYTEKLLSFILFPYMHDSINKYYGEAKQYDSFAITSIELINNYNIVTVEALSFTGPHNSPYGKEIFKFQIPYDNECMIKLLEYKHEDVEF